MICTWCGVISYETDAIICRYDICMPRVWCALCRADMTWFECDVIWKWCDMIYLWNIVIWVSYMYVGVMCLMQLKYGGIWVWCDTRDAPGYMVTCDMNVMWMGYGVIWIWYYPKLMWRNNWLVWTCYGVTVWRNLTWYIVVTCLWYGHDVRDMEWCSVMWCWCGASDAHEIWCDINVTGYESNETWYRCVVWYERCRCKMYWYKCNVMRQLYNGMGVTVPEWVPNTFFFWGFMAFRRKKNGFRFLSSPESFFNI